METLKESLETLWVTIVDMRRMDLVTVAIMGVAEIAFVSTIVYIFWSKVSW